jgi:hypothetical protein
MERSQSTRQESCQMAKFCEGPMFPGGMMGHYYYYYYLSRRFRKLRKATIRFVRSVCPSICPYALTNSAPTGQISMELDVLGLLDNLSRTFKFD